MYGADVAEGRGHWKGNITGAIVMFCQCHDINIDWLWAGKGGHARKTQGKVVILARGERTRRQPTMPAGLLTVSTAIRCQILRKCHTMEFGPVGGSAPHRIRHRMVPDQAGPLLITCYL